MNVNASCWTSFAENVRHRSGATGDVVVRKALIEEYRSRVYVKAAVSRGDEFAWRDYQFRPVTDIKYGCADPNVCEVTLGYAP